MNNKIKQFMKLTKQQALIINKHAKSIRNKQKMKTKN